MLNWKCPYYINKSLVNTTTAASQSYKHVAACTYLCIQLYKYIVPTCYMHAMHVCCHDSLKIKLFVVIYNISGDDRNECTWSGCVNPNSSSLSYMEYNFFSVVGLMI